MAEKRRLSNSRGTLQALRSSEERASRNKQEQKQSHLTGTFFYALGFLVRRAAASPNRKPNNPRLGSAVIPMATRLALWRRKGSREASGGRRVGK